MKSMVIRRFGAADLFEPYDAERPAAGRGQILARVAAASVNTADVKARELGHDLDFVPHLPATLGMDFAGWVEAVGEDVDAFAVGDEIYGCAGGVAGHGGALAEFIAADAQLVARKPKNLSMTQAAALPLVAITAWEALFDRLRIRAGDQILIHGGAGGVGHIAAQLAAAHGAKVFATDAGADRLRTIEDLGATPIDYTKEAPADYVRRLTNDRGFDAVFDTVGGDNIATSFAATALNGQVATTVSLCAVDLSLAHLKGLSLHVVYMLIPMLHDVGRARHGEILSRIATMVEDGRVAPIVDSIHPLAQVAKAHRRLESGDAVGKVVVEVAKAPMAGASA